MLPGLMLCLSHELMTWLTLHHLGSVLLSAQCDEQGPSLLPSLQDLCQHTPDDHADYRVLRESLNAMSAFISSTHDPQSFSQVGGAKVMGECVVRCCVCSYDGSIC